MIVILVFRLSTNLVGFQASRKTCELNFNNGKIMRRVGRASKPSGEEDSTNMKTHATLPQMVKPEPSDFKLQKK